MPSYGFSGGGSGGDSSGFSNSESFSGSLGRSSGDSSSASGYSMTPQQQAWLSALYPQLAAQYSAMRRPSFDVSVGGSDVVTPGNIWTEGQIQQRVNQSNAFGDQSLQTQQRSLASQLGGRGFGANSPLYQSLSTNMAAQNLGQKTAGENNLRWTAAEGNAQHLLEGQKALAQEDIGRRQIAAEKYGSDSNAYIGQQSALLNALSGFLRPTPFSSSSSKQRSENASLSQSRQQSRQQADQSSWQEAEDFNW